MRKSEALRILSRLGAPEQRRLREYCRNLATDKDPKHFDDDMRSMLRDIVKPKEQEWLEDTMNYLASVGFTQSRYQYKQIEEQLERFSLKHKPYTGWHDHFQDVKKDLINQVSSWKLKALNIKGNDDVQELIPRDDAHAGFDYILTGKRYKGDYRDGLLQYYFDGIGKAKAEGSFNRPMIIGTRTQASMPFDDKGDRDADNFKTKTRAVIMLALIQVMGESIFAKPVQQKMSSVDWYAGGKNDRELKFIINRKMRRAKYWLTVDYSKYDQSIPGWLIYECFDVIEAMFDKSFGFDEQLWKLVKQDFVHKVFIDGKGNLIEAHDGVPSGSMFTQIIDTIVNVMMIRTYFASRGMNDNHFTMMIMGDDNLIYTTEYLDKHDLGGYLDRNFGVRINVEKTTQGKAIEPPEFLSRVWTPRGVYRKPEVLVAKLLYPEHFRKYSKGNQRKLRQQVSMIISCFIHDFPLGMEWISTREMHVYSIEEMNSKERTQFTSGLMRYRLQSLAQKERKRKLPTYVA